MRSSAGPGPVPALGGTQDARVEAGCMLGCLGCPCARSLRSHHPGWMRARGRKEGCQSGEVGLGTPLAWVSLEEGSRFSESDGLECFLAASRASLTGCSPGRLTGRHWLPLPPAAAASGAVVGAWSCLVPGNPGPQLPEEARARGPSSTLSGSTECAREGRAGRQGWVPAALRATALKRGHTRPGAFPCV